VNPTLIPSVIPGDGYDGEILDSLIGGNGFGMEGGMESSWANNSNYSGVNSLLSLGLGGLHGNMGVSAGAQYLNNLNLNNLPIPPIHADLNSHNGDGRQLNHLHASQLHNSHHHPSNGNGHGALSVGGNASGRTNGGDWGQQSGEGRGDGAAWV
jgi:hypothetical protein